LPKQESVVSSTQHNLANRLTILSSAYRIQQVQRIPLDHALPGDTHLNTAVIRTVC